MHIAAAGQKKQPELIEHIVEQDDDGDLLTPDDPPDEMVTKSPRLIDRTLSNLKRLAAMSPEERRAEFRAEKPPASAVVQYRPMEDRSEGIGTGHVVPGGVRVR